MTTRIQGIDLAGPVQLSTPAVYEPALVRQLGQGWRVRKVARTYGLTIADVKVALEGRRPSRRHFWPR